MESKNTEFLIKRFNLSHYLQFKSNCALRGISMKKALSVGMSLFMGTKGQVQHVSPMLISEIPGYEDLIQEQKKVYVQPKLNGWRCMANLRTRKIYRRSDEGLGKEIITLSHINDALPVFDGIEWIDGELYHHESTLGQIQSMISRGDSRLEFHAFDVVLEDSFDIRNNELEKLKPITTYGFQIVPTISISPDQIEAYYDSYLGNKYEGMIIRLLNRSYEQCRSTSIFKKKPIIDPTK